MTDQLIDLSYDTIEGAITERGLVASGITAISKAGSAIVTVANDFVNGDIVRFSGCLGMVQMNGLTGVVSARSDTGFTVDIATNGATNTAKVVSATDAETPITLVVSTAHGLQIGDSVLFALMDEHTELNGVQCDVVSRDDDDNYGVAFAGSGDTDELTGGTGLKIAKFFTTYTGTAGIATVVGSVTNQVRVGYDDTQKTAELVQALQRAKEFLIKTRAGV